MFPPFLGHSALLKPSEEFCAMPSTDIDAKMTNPSSASVPFIDITLPSDTTEARRFQDHIEEQLVSRQVTEKEIFSVRLALEEALVNAIKHGNQYDRAKQVHVRYRFIDEQPLRFEITITDEGAGFDPEDVPDPTVEENLERTCGRGLMFMRHYMSIVEYNSIGNSVVMTKVFQGKK
jgi:serine/threonine-protein kinase RsbW